MAQKRPPPKIIVEKHENYRTIYESGIWGGHNAGFFEWVVYTDEVVVEDTLATIPPDSAKAYIKRTLQCRLYLNPFQAKIHAEWLSRHIAEYEKRFGEIVLSKEQAQKAKKLPSGIIT